MIDVGVLGEDDAVELLEGWIVNKMARKPPHDGTITKVDLAVRARMPSGWVPRVQSAITTADSEPEPDFVLARGTPDDFMQRHPGPTDIGLIVEVADTTTEKDRGEKARIYARAGVRHYWIVNLVDGVVEVYGGPSGPVEQPSYRHLQSYGTGDSVPLELPGAPQILIPVAELLPVATPTS
jgi:Uma2 family endonuclease